MLIFNPTLCKIQAGTLAAKVNSAFERPLTNAQQAAVPKMI